MAQHDATPVADMDCDVQDESVRRGGICPSSLDIAEPWLYWDDEMAMAAQSGDLDRLKLCKEKGARSWRLAKNIATMAGQQHIVNYLISAKLV
jgi:hypothetical protein